MVREREVGGGARALVVGVEVTGASRALWPDEVVIPEEASIGMASRMPSAASRCSLSTSVRPPEASTASNSVNSTVAPSINSRSLTLPKSPSWIANASSKTVAPIEFAVLKDRFSVCS